MNYVFTYGYRRFEYNFLPNNPRMNGPLVRKEYPFEFVKKNHDIYKNRGQDWAFCRILEPEWPLLKNSLKKNYIRRQTLIVYNGIS